VIHLYASIFSKHSSFPLVKYLHLVTLACMPLALGAAQLDFESTPETWSIYDQMSGINVDPSEPTRFGIEVNDQDERKGSNVRTKHIEAQPGESYQVDFDAKIESGSGIAVYLQFYDEKGKQLKIDEKGTEALIMVPATATDWQSLSLQATAPEKTKSLTIWLHSFNKNKVHAYFGNFALSTAEAIELPNSNFELGSQDWVIRDSMSSIDPRAAYRSSLGLWVNDQDKNKGSDVRSNHLTITPGQSYQLNFKAKIASGGGIALYLQFYDANGKALGSAKERTEILRAIPTNTSEWSSFALAATAPMEARSAIVWVHSFNSNTVDAYFDDFSLRVVPPAAVEQHPSEQAIKVSSKQSKPEPILTEYKKKNPGAAFAELKILQKGGSVFRQPLENWEAARKLVEDNTAWKDWLNKKQAEVDAWMIHRQDRPGWEAGWNHEFISPDDNSFLIWTAEVPGEEIDYFKSQSGKRVAITPKLFRAWVGAFRKEHVSMLIEAAKLYHLSEDPKYAEWVASQLDFYADHYDSWGKGVAQKKHSWLGFQSLDDAVIVSRLIDAARLVFDYAGPERRQKWFQHLFKPEAELLQKSYRNIHNIALWQRATEAKIALLYDDQEIWDQAVNSRFGLSAQFRYGVTSDYFWHEQSMGYNAFIIMAIDSLIEQAGLLGKQDRILKEAEIAQNMMLSPLSLRFPNNKLPNPSDNTGIPSASTTWLSRTYRTLPTYLGVKGALGTYNWDTLVDPPAEILATAPASDINWPEVKTRNMESSRFALLKEGPWQVFFHYGQVTRSHAQAEALNWSASYEGIMISQDVGTVGYGSPLYKNYYRNGLAQNIPLIGGLGQEPAKIGTLLNFDPAQASVSAAQPEYRDNVSAERTLTIQGDTLIDQVSIRSLDSQNQAPLGLSLHLEGKALIGSEFRALSQEAFAENKPSAFKYWTDLRSNTFTGSATIPVQFKQGKVLELTLEYKGDFTLTIGQAPGQPGTQHMALYLETEATDEATFTTSLKPQSAAPAPQKETRGFWDLLFGND